MPAQEVTGFFQGFNFDTLLALISCIAGVAALFVGGAAYNQCRIIKKSFNDEKKFEDESQDHSQRAAGDIINNNGISDTQLMTITTMLASMNSSNFSEALDKAYTKFQEQCDENLRAIIEESKQVIADNRFQISGYTKLDWIHFYLESAKNTSDAYMQKVWAKVLAIELAVPGSFSFKTLDVLKNMSSDDFRLFERLCSLQIDGIVIQNKALDSYLPWTDQLRLREMGLINLDGSERTVNIPAQDSVKTLICHDSLVLFMVNDKAAASAVKYQVRVLTSAAKELGPTTAPIFYRQYFIDCAQELKEKVKSQCKIQLYNVTLVNGSQFNYQNIDLLK